MSQQIQLWSLDEEDQNEVMFNDKCPYCGSKIFERVSNAEGASWTCKYCDILFYIE